MKILNINLYNCDGHLSDLAVNLLKADRLPVQNKIEIMEHIGCCEACAEKITQSFDERRLMAVPSDFSHNIYSHLNETEKKSQRNSFAFYCVRIAAAVCITLACLYSGAFSTTVTFIQQEVPMKSLTIQTPDLSFSDKIVENLSQFTNNIINMEGINNVKKEG
jgi:serine protease inhibitor